MKIVLAEKVSPATLAIFQKEPGWNVVTADKIAPGGLPAELADLQPAEIDTMISNSQQALIELDYLRDLCHSLDLIYDHANGKP